MIKTVNTKSFENEVINSKTPVLVDFFASWCSPCKMLAPVIEELSSELDKLIDVAKVNVDTDAEIADYYSVSSIPTLILLKKGEEITRLSGVMPKEYIANTIKEQVGEAYA